MQLKYKISPSRNPLTWGVSLTDVYRLDEHSISDLQTGGSFSRGVASIAISERMFYKKSPLEACEVRRAGQRSLRNDAIESRGNERWLMAGDDHRRAVMESLEISLARHSGYDRHRLSSPRKGAPRRIEFTLRASSRVASSGSDSLLVTATNLTGMSFTRHRF